MSLVKTSLSNCITIKIYINLCIKKKAGVGVVGVGIKSTDHRPTDHRPLTHRPTNLIVTDPTDKTLFQRLDR